MFIKFFKSSFFVQYLVITLAGISLWIRAFALPPPMPFPDGPTPLYQLIYALLHDYPFVATLCGFILVMAEAYGFTQILDRHELVLKNSSLPALVFVVMMSFLPPQLTLNPINLAMGLMIMILYHLLIYYNRPDHLDRIFASGFFTGIASMIYLPFLLWFLFVIVSFLFLRAGNWRAWFAAFIGLLTPFIYLVSWYFWFDELALKMPAYFQFFNTILLYPNPFHNDFWVLSVYTVAIALWGIAVFRRGPVEKTAEVRAKTSIIMWTIAFTILSLAYSRSLTVFHPALAVPALSMVISGALIKLRKPKAAEVLLLVYFLIILLNNLFIHPLIYNR